jgi:hypothetical protein
VAIDFKADLRQPFGLRAFVRLTSRNLGVLLGCDPPALAFDIESWLDNESPPPWDSEDPTDLSVGPGAAHPWLTLSIGSATEAYVSWTDEDVESEPVFRNPTSVVLAIAAIAAAADLGDGVWHDLEPPFPLVAEGPSTPEAVMDQLRVRRAGKDVEAASREVLRRSPRFVDWVIAREPLSSGDIHGR